MTQMQLERLKHAEQARHNAAMEAETNRHNVEGEQFLRDEYEKYGKHDLNKAQTEKHLADASLSKQKTKTEKVNTRIAKQQRLLKKEEVQKAKRDESREYSNFLSNVLSGGGILGSWGSSGSGKDASTFREKSTIAGHLDSALKEGLKSATKAIGDGLGDLGLNAIFQGIGTKF